MKFTYTGNKKQLRTLIESLVEDNYSEYDNVSFVTEPILYDHVYSIKSHNGINTVTQDLSKVIIGDEAFKLEEHISITIGKAEFELLGVSDEDDFKSHLHYIVIPGKGVY